MARVAFIMDRFFRQFGMSGKSFIPLLISSGCGVPGIMASRTIENEKDRRLTIMTTTFIPCSAKLPVIALLSGAIMGGEWYMAPLMYFVGFFAVVTSCIILKKSELFAGDPAPFVWDENLVYVLQGNQPFGNVLLPYGFIIIWQDAEFIIQCLTHYHFGHRLDYQ